MYSCLTNKAKIVYHRIAVYSNHAYTVQFIYDGLFPVNHGQDEYIKFNLTMACIAHYIYYLDTVVRLQWQPFSNTLIVDGQSSILHHYIIIIITVKVKNKMSIR